MANPRAKAGPGEPGLLFAFSAVAVGTMMAILNGTIANVALPTIGRAFHVDAAASIWATNGFQVPVTMGLLAAASLGQIHGFARVYRGGVVFYIIGSIVCGLAPSFPVLVLGRSIQGIGAAGVMGVGPALIRQIFPSAMLGQALGWNAMIVAISSAAGPTIGGLILSGLSWRWIFTLSAPFGVYSLVVGSIALRDRGETHRVFDLPGSLYSAAGIGLLVVSLDGLAHRINPAVVAVGVVVSLAALACFARREMRIDDPVLCPDIFRVARFTLATATSFASFFAASTAIVALPFFFQSAMGRTPLESGLMFAAWPVSTAIAAPFAGHFADRIPATKLATCGLIIFTIGLALLACLSVEASIHDILWREALCGVGFGIFQAPNNREIMSSLPEERSGNASAMLALARLVGQTSGSAMVAIVFGLAGAELTGAVRAGAHDMGALTTALWIASGMAAVAAFVSATRLHVLRARS